MGDDAHQPVALRQAGQGAVGFAEGLGVQRAESFVHEQGIQPDAGGHLHFIGQAQCQRQRSQKRLAAGQGVNTALGGVDVVHDVQLQTALPLLAFPEAPALEVILAAGHFPQAQVGPFQNPVKEGGLDVGFQHDFLFAGNSAVGRIGQGLDPDVAAVQRVHFVGLPGNVFPGMLVGGNAGMDRPLCGEDLGFAGQQCCFLGSQRRHIGFGAVCQLLPQLFCGSPGTRQLFPDAVYGFLGGGLRLLQLLQAGLQIPALRLRGSPVTVHQFFPQGGNLLFQLLPLCGQGGDLLSGGSCGCFRLRQLGFVPGNGLVQHIPPGHGGFRFGDPPFQCGNLFRHCCLLPQGFASRILFFRARQERPDHFFHGRLRGIAETLLLAGLRTGQIRRFLRRLIIAFGLLYVRLGRCVPGQHRRVGMAHGAAHRAGHPVGEGGGKDAGLLPEESLIFLVVVPQALGGLRLGGAVGLLLVFQQAELGRQHAQLGQQLLQAVPALCQLAVLRRIFFFVGTGIDQRLLFHFQGGNPGRQGFLRLPGILLGTPQGFCLPPVLRPGSDFRRQLLIHGHHQRHLRDLLPEDLLRFRRSLRLFQRLPGIGQHCALLLGGLQVPFQRRLGIRICLRLRQLHRNPFQRLFRSGQPGFQRRLRRPVLLQHPVKQRLHLRHGQFVLGGQPDLRRKGRCFVTGDCAEVLGNASFRLLPLVPDASCIVLQPVLQEHIHPGVEQFPENPLALLGVGLQQVTEVALGNHGHLCKLFPGQSDDFPDRPVHFLGPGHGGTAILVMQDRIGGLLRGAGAPGLGALVLRIAPDGIGFPGIGEGQFHIGGVLRPDIFGAQHGGLAAAAAGFAEQRKGNGIKNRGFAGTCVAGNQVKALLTKGGEIQHLHPGVGAESGQCQFQRSHMYSSPMDSSSARV